MPRQIVFLDSCFLLYYAILSILYFVRGHFIYCLCCCLFTMPSALYGNVTYFSFFFFFFFFCEARCIFKSSQAGLMEAV